MFSKLHENGGTITETLADNSHPPANLQEPELYSFPTCTLPSHDHPGPFQTPVGLLTCDPMHPSLPNPSQQQKRYLQVYKIRHYEQRKQSKYLQTLKTSEMHYAFVFIN